MRAFSGRGGASSGQRGRGGGGMGWGGGRRGPRPAHRQGPSCGAGGEDGQARGRPGVRTGRPLPRILQNCHDEATRFVHLLMSPGCNYLVQEDFVPFLQVGPPGPHPVSAPVSTSRVHTCVHTARTSHMPPPLHRPPSRALSLQTTQAGSRAPPQAPPSCCPGGVWELAQGQPLKPHVDGGHTRPPNRDLWAGVRGRREDGGGRRPLGEARPEPGRGVRGRG